MKHPKFYLMDGPKNALFGPPRKLDNPGCFSVHGDDIRVQTWVEVVFFDPVRRHIHLLKDRTSGVNSVWFLHGSFTCGTSPFDCMLDAMHRRIKTTFSRYKLRELTTNQYYFPADYSEQRQCIHALSLVFGYEIDMVELVGLLKCLDHDYIDTSATILTFNRDDLVLKRMHQVLIDAYDLLFP